MRHCFQDSSHMNILNLKFYQKINSIRPWSLQNIEFLREITSFLLLKVAAAIIYFQSKDTYLPFMILQSIGFNFFAKNRKEVVFFVVHVVLVLTLQATLSSKSKYLLLTFRGFSKRKHLKQAETK